MTTPLETLVMWYDKGQLPQTLQSMADIQKAIKRGRAVASPKFAEADDWQGVYGGDVTPSTDEDGWAMVELFDDLVPWVVVRGFNVVAEAEFHARIAQFSRSKRLIVDYERYEGFFGYDLQGNRLAEVPDMDAATTTYFQTLRDRLGPEFQIWVSVDPRQVNRDFSLACILNGAFINAWVPQTYWTTFMIGWRECFRLYVEAEYEVNGVRLDWGSTQVVPMIPGDARTSDIAAAMIWVQGTKKYKTVAIFQLGSLTDSDFNVIRAFSSASFPSTWNPPSRETLEEKAWGPLYVGISGLRAHGDAEDRRIADEISRLMDQSKSRYPA